MSLLHSLSAFLESDVAAYLKRLERSIKRIDPDEITTAVASNNSGLYVYIRSGYIAAFVTPLDDRTEIRIIDVNDKSWLLTKRAYKKAGLRGLELDEKEKKVIISTPLSQKSLRTIFRFFEELYRQSMAGRQRLFDLLVQSFNDGGTCSLKRSWEPISATSGYLYLKQQLQYKIKFELSRERAGFNIKYNASVTGYYHSGSETLIEFNKPVKTVSGEVYGESFEMTHAADIWVPILRDVLGGLSFCSTTYKDNAILDEMGHYDDGFHLSVYTYIMYLASTIPGNPDPAVKIAQYVKDNYPELEFKVLHPRYTDVAYVIYLSPKAISNLSDKSARGIHRKFSSIANDLLNKLVKINRR